MRDQLTKKQIAMIEAAWRKLTPKQQECAVILAKRCEQITAKVHRLATELADAEHLERDTYMAYQKLLKIGKVYFA